jgi:hypothetical protein
VGAFRLVTGGSIWGVHYFNDSDLAYPNESLSGSVTLGPSSTPATTFSTPSFPLLTFDVYAIDSTHLKFIETDGLEFLSGDAFSQTSTVVSTGSLAFTLAGVFDAGSSAAGGFLVTDGNGNITSASTEDANDGGNPSSGLLLPTGTYSDAGSVTASRTVLTLSGFFGGSQYAAYPSSGGLLLLEIDDSGIMVGAAYPQTSTSVTAPQGYALNLTGNNLPLSESNEFTSEVDDIGEFATASTGATFTGLVDENYAPGGSPLSRQVLDGTFAAPDSNGRGSLVTTTTNGTLNGGVGLTFYSVDGTTFPFIETDDGQQVTTGVMVVQSATGASPAVAARTHMYVPHPFVRARSARKWQKKVK